MTGRRTRQIQGFASRARSLPTRSGNVALAASGGPLKRQEGG